MAEKAELALEILQTLLAQGKLAYALADKNLRIQEVSPNLQEFLRFSEPLAGKALNEVFDALAGAEQVLEQVFEGFLPEYRLEYINYEQGDFLGYITLNVWKHSRPDGQSGFLLIAEDVTSSGYLEQRAVQTRNELQLMRLELDRANAELQRQALFDALTGLPNRRYLDDELQRYVEFAHRHGTPLAAIMLDLDNFKLLNDTHGHPEGDQCLRILAAAIRDSIRVTDFAARYGGEEFCIFLPMADTSQAIALARRIQSNLALKIIHTPIKFTMSIGAASSSAKEATFTAANLLKKADDALYQAKREGKNRICVFMDNGK